MTKGHTSLITKTMMVVVAASMVGATLGQNLTPGQCKEEKDNLEQTCRSVALIFGRNPTAACCQLVRTAHVECVCPYVSSKLVAAVGGPKRLIRLVGSCGRFIPRNFKCGSVTTPR
ncbi:hypothetical protein BUALT_Bualt06G0078800 [Buddleja alternifolia]|uniref:Bifunctional inhibitor/plant lipid transfer protein/seed storage helical domain-containing protein n=1 Tax=Buddleja alternifolia TaxID=168488 RepID=A0AAV6XLF6_9LAMI|nr:hypothetical protein BUALT_Bualt06G0078800 [Buddleja alternifolia]